MARKRIKTLALEWNVSVEDVLHSCERLKLAHGRSDASLLAPEEAERIRADLNEQANRAALLRRETVFETTAGKVVEKRLNETVMRRRHSEPEAPPPPAPSQGGAEPFHFELESAETPDLAAPFLETMAEPEPTLELPEVAPAAPEVASATAQAPAAISPPQVAENDSPASASEAPTPPLNGGARLETTPAADAKAATERMQPVPPPQTAKPNVFSTPPVQPGAVRNLPGGRVSVSPSGVTRETVRPTGRTQVINLARGHASAPVLDDQQQGPKVLGKIDLRKAVPARPATPPTRPGGPPLRPGMPGGPGRPTMGGPRMGRPVPSAPVEAPAMPVGQAPAKPGARAIKKRRVVKKEPGDLIAEREIRGGRFPKKRRALPGKEQRKTEITTPRASKRVVRVSEGVTVADLARNMGVKAAEVIKKLMTLGLMSTVNQVLDVDTATLVASEFGYNVENVAFDVEAAIEEGAEEATAENQLPRPPVVTVMGHVDHGKTSLLDAIRHTSVTADEFGGITQHIGAYTVEVNGRSITFVDTPGHEAFTAMRARGAKVTDIVILVVAANEGVMPQTVEAINHARAAQVPIIVAINKIDLPEANVDRVKQRLTEQGLIPEDYGGDTITVPVSARTGEGIERLLEMVLLQADVMELKANPDRPARGTVIEAQLDRGRGPVATVLVQEGTLHQGDPFVCGTTYGRVRAMLNHLGQRLTQAGPSTPVEIFGLSGVPEPGVPLIAVADEARARQVAEFRQSKAREGILQKTSRLSLEELSERMAAGEVKELRVIIKGDVNGSVEALADSLQRLSTNEVKLELIHKSVGAISETDVTLASASKALIIGFNVRPEPKAAQLAEKEGVEIRLYTIIYEVINDIRDAMEGLLAPTFREKALGRAEVRQTFVVQGNTIAGSMVLDGKVMRNARARLVRDGRVVWEGKLASLRRFKDDVREVQAGYECGVGLENFNDVKPGDVIENFELETVLRKLETPKAEPMRGQGAQLQT